MKNSAIQSLSDLDGHALRGKRLLQEIDALVQNAMVGYNISRIT